MELWYIFMAMSNMGGLAPRVWIVGQIFKGTGVEQYKARARPALKYSARSPRDAVGT